MTSNRLLIYFVGRFRIDFQFRLLIYFITRTDIYPQGFADQNCKICAQKKLLLSTFVDNSIMVWRILFKTSGDKVQLKLLQ